MGDSLVGRYLVARFAEPVHTIIHHLQHTAQQQERERERTSASFSASTQIQPP